MIAPAAWYCGQDCGYFNPTGKSWHELAVNPMATAEVPALVGKSLKYYARMTPEARYGLCAASLALKGAGWETSKMEMGILAAGCDGCAAANEAYFREYVDNGRTLGRGNLFIYTLPTSAAGEISIALGLGGPCLAIHNDADPLGQIARCAAAMVRRGEAAAMLGLWSDGEAAVCLPIDASTDAGSSKSPEGISRPIEMCRYLASQVISSQTRRA
jgi:3-oxoacyl-(acyl-carrier-protein) synthase